MTLVALDDRDFVLLGFALALIVENTAVLIFDGNLIGLHIFLKIKGISTYDYVVLKKMKNKRIRSEKILKESSASDNPDVDKTITGPGKSIKGEAVIIFN
jgi:hypothetical protein